MCHHLRCSGLNQFVDTVRSGLHTGIRIGNIGRHQQFRRHASVGGDQQFADSLKLCTRLSHSNLLTVQVRGLGILENLVRMSIQHHVDATGVIHQQMRVETHRLCCLAHMRQQHHIIGTFGAGVVHRLLHLLVERLRSQVVFQSAVGVVECISLQQHRLGCRGTDESHLLVAILLDDVRHVHQLLVSHVIQVAAHNRCAQLFQQHLHARNTIV